MLLSGKAPDVDETCPEMLKALNIVGLSWVARLFNITWRLWTVPAEWTGGSFHFLKRGDQRV